MKVIGLTGSIASGKSTVAAMLRDANIPVIDADELAREAVSLNTPALKEITHLFGQATLNADGSLNRKALGSLVFDDDKKRKQLEAIVHPEVRRLFFDQLAQLEKRGANFVVYMAPLLFETNIYKSLEKNVLVVADEQIMIERVNRRDGLTFAETAKRISAQMSNSEKIALADAVIVNNGSIEELEKNLKLVWLQITGAPLKVNHN